MKVKHEHVVQAPRDTVLAAYRDDTFYVEKLKNSGALTVDIVEREELPGDRLRRKMKVSEPSRVPSFLRKSEVDTYEDNDVLDCTAGTLTWKVTPQMMADKFFLSGAVEFHPEGAATRIVFHTELEVRIAFVGGQAEKIGLGKTEEEVTRQVDFLRKWLKEH